MKHLNLFNENVNTDFWLMTYDITNDYTTYHLFSDEESCKNMILDIINEERGDYDENYSDEKYFTDAIEAMTWYHKTFNDIKISYEKIELKEKYEGSKKLQLMKSTRKYNL